MCVCDRCGRKRESRDVVWCGACVVYMTLWFAAAAAEVTR
jgi:hypothetical protein